MNKIDREWEKEFDKKFKDCFVDEWFVCGECGHPWESHYWNGGGNMEASGYDACHVDECNCGYPKDKKVHSEVRPEYKDFKDFIAKQITQARLQDRKEILESLERFFEPATSTRGQGGLPITGSITDWKMTVTKYGWEQFKEHLLPQIKDKQLTK